MKETILYCGKLGSGDFFHFYAHPDLVRMCGYDEVFKTCVTEAGVVEDVHAEMKDMWGGYYAWWDEERREFQFIAPHLHAVEICFPYGSKAEVEKGAGNVYRVKVEVLDG